MKMLKNKFALSEHRYQFEYLQKQEPCAIIWALVSGLWKNSPLFRTMTMIRRGRIMPLRKHVYEFAGVFAKWSKYPLPDKIGCSQGIPPRLVQ